METCWFTVGIWVFSFLASGWAGYLVVEMVLDLALEDDEWAVG